jgi:HD-GYP domain-containing protein (c-di-GMP phosphodiesterase class II)
MPHRATLRSAPPAPHGAPGLHLSELIASLSYAIDLTEGQPRGHCVRSCWVGMNVADTLGLDARERWDLYYTLLLKDLGCSSNAARMCALWASDDLLVKRDFKVMGDTLPEVLRFVFGHTGLQAGLAARLRSTVNLVVNGSRLQQELIETRCSRGADIARRLRFGDGVAHGIASLDEHWDGGGHPLGLAGADIPLYSRIALLAQVTDVFHATSGSEGALAVVRQRSGRWFDPALVAALEHAARRPGFWQVLGSETPESALADLAPAAASVLVDDDHLDDIAAAFGQVVDAKSPYTAGHSERVAMLTDAVAAGVGLPPARRRWLVRGALLHDVGKLGVSNTILDKPGRLDEAEWAAVRKHAVYTEEILSRIGAMSDLAVVAAAHHERLDGAGYPRGLRGDQISLETRVITTCDVFDAISAERPYRAAVPIDQTLAIMRQQSGTAFDPRCLDALEEVIAVGGPRATNRSRDGSVRLV